MTDEQDTSLVRNDLLLKMIPYLNKHLIFPLLNDLDYSEEVTKLKFQLLKHTNMTDFVGGLDAELRGLKELPKEYIKKKDEVARTKEHFEMKCCKIIGLLESPEVIADLRNDKVANQNYLKEHHGVTIDMVNSLFDYAKFQYGCGFYAGAADLLYQFRILSTDSDKVTEATWGKLACEILSQEWAISMDEILKVKESIDTRLFNNPLAQLRQRAWLIHWALFPYFNYEPAPEVLTDLFFSPAYIITIQTLCPWILRYLTVSVVISRNRSRNSNTFQKQQRDLIRVVKQVSYEFSDPVTDFIKALYIDFDFEEAQKKLARAEQVLNHDFFLAAVSNQFVDSARHLISESYCKIHQRIDIRDLSSRLGLSLDDGEKWIVNLIRDTRVDAKIDYQEGTVIMNHPPQSVYQQIIERTKGGFFRTQVMSAALS